MDSYPREIICEICSYFSVGDILRLSECCTWTLACINTMGYGGICMREYPQYVQRVRRWSTYEQHAQLLSRLDWDLRPVLSAIGPNDLHEKLGGLLYHYKDNNPHLVLDALICVHNIPYIYEPLSGGWREYWRVIFRELIDICAIRNHNNIIYILDKYWHRADMWMRAHFIGEDWQFCKYELHKTDHIYKIENLHNYIYRN